MYKNIGTLSITSALLLASASCLAQSVPVTLNTQFNSGTITSGVPLQNIIVDTVTVGSTAIGNLIDSKTLEQGVAINGSTATQTNTGSTNASVSVVGTTTQFKKITVNALSAGNMQNYTSIASINAAAQMNTGAIGASMTWSHDPTGEAWINSTALGNVQTFSFAK